MLHLRCPQENKKASSNLDLKITSFLNYFKVSLFIFPAYRKLLFISQTIKKVSFHLKRNNCHISNSSLVHVVHSSEMCYVVCPAWIKLAQTKQRAVCATLIIQFIKIRVRVKLVCSDLLTKKTIILQFH